MIRLARESDLSAIADIYDRILDQEARRPVSYTNWQRGSYPTRESARQALLEGTLWVLEEEGEVTGCVNLNALQLPEYQCIPWRFSVPEEQVRVIHTLVIRPDRAGRGLARRLVSFCEEEARRQGAAVIRLDTYEGNLPANTMYPRLGYRLAGAAEFFFQGFIHEVLNCYEKEL